MTAPRAVVLLAAASLLGGGAGAWLAVPGSGVSTARAGARTEVVVRLSPPALAAGGDARAVDAAQAAFTRALATAVPSAHVRWRYRLVLDGLAVTAPERDVPRLAALPGVAETFAARTYRSASVGPAADQIGAPQLWGPALTTAGQGVKIGIIDDGVDQTHPFFDPSGYTMPPGYPKGNVAATTAKVIVSRTFPAPGQTAAVDRAPFDPQESHGTHVAGIAAGNAGTRANGAIVSGVAPKAYLGNYRALTVPTDGGVGKDGNAAELVAAIEAAVADGMNVINLSIGEAEIDPTRDVVALALDGAAASGVVPVVSAGNDYEEFGAGSVSSPGTSARAITVGAVSTDRAGSANVVASFSSAGPTTISLRQKPDVAAPGTDVLSSYAGARWSTLSGTSMAAPHVSGAAAVLRQRHPDWSVDQLKSALIDTADPAYMDDQHLRPAEPDRVGAGVVDLPRADRPLIFASPASVSLGLVHAGQSASASVAVADAGGGGGTWSVSVQARTPSGAAVSAPPTLSVPGTLSLTVSAAGDAAEGDVTGTILLQLGAETRRIPFWSRVTRPQLGRERATLLRATGTYRGDTRAGKSLVSSYRYPQFAGNGQAEALRGPEQVFRVTLTHPVANFGVTILSRAKGVKVQPRIVAAADENRLVGYAGLPVVLNPYLDGFGDPVLTAGAIRPVAGTYDVVFDSPTAAGAGRYSFRYWVDDTTPPTARVAARRVTRGAPLVVQVSDRGAGIDRASAVVRVDGASPHYRFVGGQLRIQTGGLKPGPHVLRLQLSDNQESRNMENVAAILPNTRRLTARFAVAR